MNIALFLVWASIAVSAPNIIDLLHQLPACSVQCLLDGITDDGCAMTDLTCQCAKLGSLKKTVSPCLSKAGCSPDEIAQMAPVVTGLCEKQAGNSHATASKTPGMATHLQHAKWVSVAALVTAMLLL